MSDHSTGFEATIHCQRVGLSLSECSQDFELCDLKQVENSTTQPLKEVELSVRKHHNIIGHGNVITAFMLYDCDPNALDQMYLFRAGRVDDCHFQHHVFLVARTKRRESRNLLNRVIVGLGIYSTVIDKGESNRWKELAIRKDLRKIALENLKRHFKWSTLAASLRSFSETSWICEESTSDGTLKCRFETEYLQLLSLVGEIPLYLESVSL